MKPEVAEFMGIVLAARDVARAACDKAIEEHKAYIAKSDRPDRHYDHIGACGFAWVEVSSKGRTPFTNAMIALNKMEGAAPLSSKWGERQTYGQKRWMFWNPGEYHGQNINAKEAGAEAFAAYLTASGIPAYARSRLD